MSMDEQVDTPKDDDLMVVISADPDTWMPLLVLGISSDDAAGGYVHTTLSPEDGYLLAHALAKMSSATGILALELQEKTLEQRREILELESSLVEGTLPWNQSD